MTKLTRRELALLIGGSLLAGAVGGYIGRGMSQPPQQGPPTPPQQKDSVFGDKEVDTVAAGARIYPGSFFMFEPKTLDGLHGFTSDMLHPIYPPAVFRHKKLIYRLADEFKIPAGVIATIMTIESAGNEKAESDAGAQGLFQVMPFHFPQGLQKDPDKMKDPYMNGKVGMEYFTQNCLPGAQRGLPNYRTDHPSVYARGLIAYNGGAGKARAAFDELYDESKYYGDHFIRFAVTAELAEGLRVTYNRTDAAIVAKLSSAEIDARAYALERFVEKTDRNFDYDAYRDVLTELSYPIPGINPVSGATSELGMQINIEYRKYKSNPTYQLPLSPGLRIWVSFGGYPLFASMPINMSSNEYARIATSRT